MDYLSEMNDLSDFEALLQMKSQKDAIVWSGFEKGPDPETYKQYVLDSIINNPKNHLFILKDEATDEAMGYCQFVEEENGVFEGRGSGILKKFQGCGLAEEMALLFLEKAKEYGCKYMYSWCSEKNLPSINALLSGGWNKTDVCKHYHMNATNEDHLFYKWEKVF